MAKKKETPAETAAEAKTRYFDKAGKEVCMEEFYKIQKPTAKAERKLRRNDHGPINPEIADSL